MTESKEPADVGAGTRAPVKRAKLSPRVRFEVFKRDNFRCVYCGVTADTSDLHVDHREPVAGGGGSGDDNLVTACAACNTGKGPVLLTERRLALPKEPKPLRCPVHGKQWQGHEFACTYGRRHLNLGTCREQGCHEFVLYIDTGKGWDFVRPPEWLTADVISDAHGWDRADHTKLYGRWDTITPSIPKPWSGAVIETDLHHLDGGLEEFRAMGLTERWGRTQDEVDRALMWWDWQISEHGL